MIQISKDVNEVLTYRRSIQNELKPASIYFYRPFELFRNEKRRIIVGTLNPDEVIVSLEEGFWYRTLYQYYGDRSFISGYYQLSQKTLNIIILPETTYYIKCVAQTQDMKMIASLELVNEERASKEMEKLRRQAHHFLD